MKRLRRIIFNGLTVLSLVLCVGTVGMWVRSYYHADLLRFVTTTYIQRCAVAFDGKIVFARTPTQELPAHRLALEHFRPEIIDYDVRRVCGANLHEDQWQFLGVQHHRRVPGNAQMTVTIIPIWIPTSVCSLPALVVALSRITRTKRNRDGKCPICGYDLRATPDRCPECGTIPAKT